MCRKHSLSSRSSGIQKSLDHEKLLNGHEELILVIVSSGTGMRRIPWNNAFIRMQEVTSSFLSTQRRDRGWTLSHFERTSFSALRQPESQKMSSANK